MKADDGRRYVGNWRKGLKHGVGTMTWPEGHRYDGQWQRDQREGRGTQSYAKGSYQDGFSGFWHADKEVDEVNFWKARLDKNQIEFDDFF